LKEEIKNGTIGDVLQVFVTFGVQIADVDRVRYVEVIAILLKGMAVLVPYCL
jgi:hypothetical protein